MFVSSMSLSETTLALSPRSQSSQAAGCSCLQLLIIVICKYSGRHTGSLFVIRWGYSHSSHQCVRQVPVPGG